MLYCNNLLEDANIYTLLTWNVNHVRNIMIKTYLQIYSSNGCTNSNFILNFKVSKMEQVMPTKVDWLIQLTSCCHCCGDCIESTVSSFWGCDTGQFQQNVSNQCGMSNTVEGPWLTVSEGNRKVSDLQVTRFTLKGGKFSFSPWDNESKTKCE